MNQPPSSEDTALPIYEPTTTLTGTELTAVPQPKIKTRVKVEPDPASRLAYLLSQLPELETQKRESEEKLKECKKAIQQEVAAFTAANGLDVPDVFDLPADPYGAHPAYTLSARPGALHVDTEALKAQDKDTYDKWAVRGDPYWELRRVQRNRVHRG